MSLKQIIFSFGGRIGRETWWAYFVSLIFAQSACQVLLAIFIAFLPFLKLGEGLNVILTLLAFLAVAAVTTWVGLALGAKRLHDQNKSAWWLIGPTPPILSLALPGFRLFLGVHPWLFWSLLLYVILFGVYMLICFGFLRGTQGENRFGPDPLSSAGESEAAH